MAVVDSSEIDPAAAGTPHDARWCRWAKGAVALAALLVLAVGGRHMGDLVLEFASWVRGLGAWGPLVFAGGYALAVAAFVPGSVLTLAAGALFGLRIGIVTVFAAATAGSTLAFLIARYLARPVVARRIARNPRFAAVDQAIAERGGGIAFLLRLSPVVPFNALNYALGVTRISLRDYLFAAAGMLPGTVLYVYYGKLAGELAALAGGAQTPRGAGYYVILGLGLVATLAVTTWVTRIARGALRDATGAEEPTTPEEAR